MISKHVIALFFMSMSVIGLELQASAVEGIDVAESLQSADAGEVQIDQDALRLSAMPGTWYAAGQVAIPLNVKTLREGVLSFWMMPLAEPASTAIVRTDRRGAVGWSVRQADKIEIVRGGDLKKKRIYLRIILTRNGEVEANHLSWYRKNHWLEGVKSLPNMLQPGKWVHVAYGVGKEGQRLWIDGQLVAHNAKGTEPISWSDEISLGGFAGLVADIQLHQDTATVDAVASGQRSFPEGRLPTVAHQLMVIEQDTKTRQARLASLSRKLGPLPYERARLNIIQHFVPLALFHALRLSRESVDASHQGLDALYESQIEWLITAAQDWDHHMNALAMGEFRPKVVPFVRPSDGKISVHSGAFWQNERPIYLAGPVHPDPSLGQELGFQIATFVTGPKWEMPQKDRLANTGDRLRHHIENASKECHLVDLLYEQAAPTWVVKTWPELAVGTGFNKHDMLSPRGWRFHESTLHSVLSHLGHAENLFTIDLSNEPSFDGVTVDSPQQWIAWLKEKHTSVELLNSRWGTDHAAWEEIEVPAFVSRKRIEAWAQQFPTEAANLCIYGDWARFNLDRVTAWFAKVNAIVKEHCPQSFTYTKMIQNPTRNARRGIDIVANVRHTDLNGSDSWWVFRGLEAGGTGSADQMSGTEEEKDDLYAVTWQPSLMLGDLLTSANRNAPVVNGEMHFFHGSGDPAPSGDRLPGHWDRPIPANHFFAGVWQQAIHGSGMFLVWRNWPRNNLFNRPDGLDGFSRAMLDLNRLADEVHAINTAPRKVGILWGLSPVLWDTSGELQTSVSRDWWNLWMAVTLNGLRPRFIFERDLAQGKMPDVDVLLVHAFSHIEPTALEGLRLAMNEGLELWVVGDNINFAFDPYNRGYGESERPTYERVLNQEEFEQDPVKLLHRELAEAGLLPSVQVVEHKPSARPLVHWCVATHRGKTLVNLCNYGRRQVEVTLIGFPGAVAMDLIANETVNSQAIVLDTEQVRLIAQE